MKSANLSAFDNSGLKEFLEPKTRTSSEYSFFRFDSCSKELVKSVLFRDSPQLFHVIELLFQNQDKQPTQKSQLHIPHHNVPWLL